MCELACVNSYHRRLDLYYVIAEWWNGEWRNGGWNGRNGGMAEWRNGHMVIDGRNGGMVMEWRNGGRIVRKGIVRKGTSRHWGRKRGKTE